MPENTPPEDQYDPTQEGYDENAEELEGEDAAIVSSGVATPLICWMASTGVHVVLLTILAFVTTFTPYDSDAGKIATKAEEPEEEFVEEIEEPEPPPPPPEELQNYDPQDVVSPTLETNEAEMSVDMQNDVLDEPPPMDLMLDEAGPVLDFNTSNFTDIMGSKVDGKGGFRNFGKTGRLGMAIQGGGTKDTEAAVAAALYWLARHQLPNGSWNYTLPQINPYISGGETACTCSNKGTYGEYVNAASGMGVLPFLAYGETHQKKPGKTNQTQKGAIDFSKVIGSCLSFLKSTQKITKNGGHWMEGGHGGMYGHGIASIAMCELYAMTKDKNIHASAQQAVNFIVHAQDPIGGGWRYKVKEKGDTSVVGWMIMTLKSAHLAYLTVPPGIEKKASSFLTSVQYDGGAKYGYTKTGHKSNATTAIGLISRMFLGDFEQDDPALQRGMTGVTNIGFGKGAYYNYYGTQVAFQTGTDDPRWKKWNDQMKRSLLNNQAKDKDSCEYGSWFLGKGSHGDDKGGRLMSTAMNCLCLEVYYRHMPIFKKEATTTKFHIPEVEAEQPVDLGGGAPAPAPAPADGGAAPAPAEGGVAI